MKIGIIKEGKIPADTRVALTPKQCKALAETPNVEIYIQKSSNRCFSDEEYLEEGLTLVDTIDHCDVLIGVKEVPIEQLIANKKYFFFSHTIKAQAYNKRLLQSILAKNIQLVDWEVLTNSKKARLIAFGFFAGIVGAHNGIMTYGLRTGAYALKRMNNCFDYEEANAIYKALDLPAMKIVITGTGRVGQGAAKVLNDMGVEQVSRADFLYKTFDKAVYFQVKSKDWLANNAPVAFVEKEYFKNPEQFHSTFEPFTKVADLMINGIYWDNKAPQFFSKEAMKSETFTIKVIADVTCDIAPVSSIPSTLFASTIENPIFGYDVLNEKEAEAHRDGVVDMMTVDNLPNELPRDASTSFGKQFIDNVWQEVLDFDNSAVINRATIAKNGSLGEHFLYLEDYVK